MFVLTFFLPTTIITWQTNKSEHLKLMNYNFEFFQLGFKKFKYAQIRSKLSGLVVFSKLTVSSHDAQRTSVAEDPLSSHCKRSFFGENYIFVFQNCLISFLGTCFNCFFESLFNCWPINYLSQQLVFFPVSQYWFRDSVCTREEKMRIMSLKIKDMDSLYHGAKISI